MKLHLSKNQYIETNNGIDLSIPIRTGENNVNAWYCNPVDISPVVSGDFIGDVNQGSPVNFKNITLNPHGNGTHTECVGHISKEPYTINQCLKEFHFMAELISVNPAVVQNKEFDCNDLIIEDTELKKKIKNWQKQKALIVRTLDNSEEKINRQYSGTNPAYFSQKAMAYINHIGVEHLMVDLPSVDREVDNGKLACHHLFWNYPSNTQSHKTISELLFIPNSLVDGTYFIQIQIMSIESDASPSKILAHPIIQD